jgi:alkaline phosphatase D
MAWTRRKFLGTSLSSLALADEVLGQVPPESRQATGVKVGEVTDTSAIVWMRRTLRATHRGDGKPIQRGATVVLLPDDVNLDELRGACTGAPGAVRLRYGTTEDLKDAAATDWHDVTPRTDFAHAFTLRELRPATTYYYEAQTRDAASKPDASLRGRFMTAPTADAEVRFTVVSCTGYKDVDHPDGYHIYPAMATLRPHFWVHTGDNVYLDNDDFRANTVAKARHHWNRMYGLPRAVEFNLKVPGYWEKDDHDTWYDDCWPGAGGKIMAPLTYAEGLAIYREQVPMGERNYRTFKWGRGVQVWFTEGRDFRSPNGMADGPEKSIWGKEQKAWLMRTLLESRAEYKILISPTPLVGPDRPNKRDNHTNANFQHEGNEFRAWAQKNLGRNFITICGDRHWQYHSVHPETGLHEFGCGAGSDRHAGGSPGEDKRYHRYHRVQGGFVSATYDPAKKSLVVRHHDVHGKATYEHTVGS